MSQHKNVIYNVVCYTYYKHQLGHFAGSAQAAQCTYAVNTHVSGTKATAIVYNYALLADLICFDVH